MDKREILKEYIIMAFGALCVAVAVNFFMVPGDLVFGSASGLSLVLTQVFPVKMSVMNLAINVFFLVLGFLFVGKEFGAKTVFISVMSCCFVSCRPGLLRSRLRRPKAVQRSL